MLNFNRNIPDFEKMTVFIILGYFDEEPKITKEQLIFSNHKTFYFELKNFAIEARKLQFEIVFK